MYTFKPRVSHAELVASIMAYADGRPLPKGFKFPHPGEDILEIDGRRYYLNLEDGFDLERLLERVSAKPARRKSRVA